MGSQLSRLRGHVAFPLVIAALFVSAAAMLSRGHREGWVPLGLGVLYLVLLALSLLSALRSRRSPAGETLAGRARMTADAPPPSGEVIPDDPDVIGIHRMEGYGYRLVNGQWYEVGFHRRDSLLLLSGTKVEIKESAEPDQDWMIAGRAEDGRVALAGFAAGRFSGARRSVEIDSLLVQNPKLMRGQLVSYHDADWKASETPDGKLALLCVGREPQLVDARALVTENLDQLLERVVMIVDSG